MLSAYAIVFFSSLLQAAISTFVSVALALPLAHFFNRFSFVGRRFFLSLVPFFCIMPTKICALSVGLFYDADGIVGIIIAHVLMNLPFAFYLLHASYQKVDYTLEWIAQDLGATWWQAYRESTWPVISVPLFAVATLIFVLCFSSFSIPLVLGTADYHYTPAIMLFRSYNDNMMESFSVYYFLRALVVWPLVIWSAKTRVTSISIHTPIYISVQRYRAHTHGVFWLFYGIGVMALLGGPLVSLLMYGSYHNAYGFIAMVGSGRVDSILGLSIIQVIKNSISIAFLSSLFSLIIGFIMSMLVWHAQHYFGASFWTMIALVPLLLGSLIITMIFKWGVTFLSTSSLTVITLSHVVLNYPFVFRLVSAQLCAHPKQLNLLARSLGATTGKLVRTILIPFIRPAFLRAWCIAFGLSLSESGAGSMIASKQPMTIPLAIKAYRAYGQIDGVLGMGFILLFLVVGTTYLASFFED